MKDHKLRNRLFGDDGVLRRMVNAIDSLNTKVSELEWQINRLKPKCPKCKQTLKENK